MSTPLLGPGDPPPFETLNESGTSRAAGRLRPRELPNSRRARHSRRKRDRAHRTYRLGHRGGCRGPASLGASRRAGGSRGLFPPGDRLQSPRRSAGPDSRDERFCPGARQLGPRPGGGGRADCRDFHALSRRHCRRPRSYGRRRPGAGACSGPQLHPRSLSAATHGRGRSASAGTRTGEWRTP